MNYEKMLKFVKETLEANDAIRPKKPNQGFRDRYEHTERVFKWCKILMKDYVLINEEVCLTAAIFHDVGYAYGQDNHPHNGVLLFQDYALKNDFDTEFIKQVSDIIEVHSDKSLLKKYDKLLEKFSDLYRTDIPADYIKLIVKEQINNMKSWTVERQSVTGSGSSGQTYSFQGSNLWIMIPNMDSVNKATVKILKYMNGD